MKQIMRRSQSGFTLIELLVVIAIIAILSTIVLSSLGTARQRARNTRAKSEISQLRAQAELYFTVENGFNGVCTAVKSGQGLKEMLDSIKKNAETENSVVCAADASAWAVIADIKDESRFCADSTGYAGPATENSGPTESSTGPVACTPLTSGVTTP